MHFEHVHTKRRCFLPYFCQTYSNDDRRSSRAITIHEPIGTRGCLVGGKPLMFANKFIHTWLKTTARCNGWMILFSRLPSAESHHWSGEYRSSAYCTFHERCAITDGRMELWTSLNFIIATGGNWTCCWETKFINLSRLIFQNVPASVRACSIPNGATKITHSEPVSESSITLCHTTFF